MSEFGKSKEEEIETIELAEEDKVRLELKADNVPRIERLPDIGTVRENKGPSFTVCVAAIAFYATTFK